MQFATLPQLLQLLVECPHSFFRFKIVFVGYCVVSSMSLSARAIMLATAFTRPARQQSSRRKDFNLQYGCKPDASSGVTAAQLWAQECMLSLTEACMVPWHL